MGIVYDTQLAYKHFLLANTMTDNYKTESAIEKWNRAKQEGRPLAEHILNVIKAGLSSAPFAGAIASLMSDYIPAARALRLEEFAEQIGADLW